MPEWQDQFQSRLDDKKKAQQEERKSFQVYRDKVVSLFEGIEAKVRAVAAIQVSRRIVGRTEAYRMDVKGPFETIKSLCLRCGERTLEFVPDGINTPVGRGRIRVVHSSRKLGQFVYLYLVKDPRSDRPFPENLAWVVQDQKDGMEPTRCPVFDDRALERLIEVSFLEE